MKWCTCPTTEWGICLGCLIEKTVRLEFGTQGLDYLKKHLIPDGARIARKLPECETEPYIEPLG